MGFRRRYDRMATWS